MGKKRNTGERAGVFFDALFPTIPEGCAVEMRIFEPGETRKPPVAREWIDNAEAYRQIVEKNPGLNIYHGVALRRSGKGGKQDIRLTHALWAEVDTDKLGADTMEVAKLIHGIDPSIRPSACISSGHGLHFYWFLADPLADLEAIEKCNTVLRDFVGGDNVWNADRIFRSPGSWNNKYAAQKACEPIWLYPWMKYDAEELTSDVLGTGVVLWHHSDRPSEFTSVEEARSFQEELRLTDDDAARITQEDRRKSKNARGEKVWERVRYHGGPGYVGLDEAIMLYTANAYCRIRPDADRDAAMRGIVGDTLAHIRAIWERDAGNESWDWRAEEKMVWAKLKRWAAKWDGGLKGKSNGGRAAKGQRVSGQVASSR